MATGDLLAVAVLGLGGVAVTAFGYRIRRDERADLVFSPGSDADPVAGARASGTGATVAGVATAALGLAVLLTPATGVRWLVLLSAYGVVCLPGALPALRLWLA